MPKITELMIDPIRKVTCKGCNQVKSLAEIRGVRVINKEMYADDLSDNDIEYFCENCSAKTQPPPSK